MLSRHWLHELTRPAFEEWLKDEPAPVVIIGVGSLEQHGPHLPLGTDSLLEEKVNFAVEFIRRWKTIPVPPAYQNRPVSS